MGPNPTQHTLCLVKIKKTVPVAQLVRAPLCGSGGRGFESRQAPILSKRCFITMQENLFVGPTIGRSTDSDLFNPRERWDVLNNHRPINNNFFSPGCPVQCIYCNQQAFEMDPISGEKATPYISLMVDGGISLNTRLMSGTQLTHEIEPKELLDAFNKSPFFDPDASLLIENFNDPGVNWKKTLDLLKLLNEQKHVGPVIILTKLGISDEFAEELAQLKANGLKIIFSITYANLPKTIEPVDSIYRLRALKKIYSLNIPTIVSIRPMIKGLNDGAENIKKILSDISPFSDVITVGGLFVYDGLTQIVFEKAGFSLDPVYFQDIYSMAKILPPEIKEQFRKHAIELNVKAPIIDHYSCCIAHICTLHYNSPRSDRMARWANASGHSFSDCCENCLPEQKAQCLKKSQEKPEDIIFLAKEAARKIGYSKLQIVKSPNISGLLLILNGSLAINEIFFIEQHCGWDVNNVPDSISFIIKVKEVLTQELNMRYEEVVEEINLNEAYEWIIKVKNDCNKTLIQKFLRGKIRSRILVV